MRVSCRVAGNLPQFVMEGLTIRPVAEESGHFDSELESLAVLSCSQSWQQNQRIATADY